MPLAAFRGAMLLTLWSACAAIGCADPLDSMMATPGLDKAMEAAYDAPYYRGEVPCFDGKSFGTGAIPSVEGTWHFSDGCIFVDSSDGSVNGTACAVDIAITAQHRANETRDEATQTNAGAITSGQSNTVYILPYSYRTDLADTVGKAGAQIWIKTTQTGGGCTVNSISAINMHLQDGWACGFTYTFDKSCKVPDWFTWTSRFTRQ